MKAAAIYPPLIEFVHPATQTLRDDGSMQGSRSLFPNAFRYGEPEFRDWILTRDIGGIRLANYPDSIRVCVVAHLNDEDAVEATLRWSDYVEILQTAR